MTILIEDCDQGEVLSATDSRDFVYILLGIHNGVYRMSPDIEGLVETSNNLAKITLENGALEIACLTRSSVESSKEDLASTITGVMKLGGLQTDMSGEYPGGSLIKIVRSWK